MQEKSKGETKAVKQQKQKYNVLNTQTKKKTQKSMSMGAVFSIIFIVAVIGFFIMVYFDIGGMKQTVVTLLELDVPTDEQIATADEQLALADQEWTAIEQKQRELDKKLGELGDLEQELLAKEQTLNNKMEEQDSEQQQALAEQEVLTSAAQIFEQMTSENAADAISGLETVEEMARLLMHMTSEKAAEIMEEMDSDLTSEITSKMINQ